jgi:SAM-dependent methyltransferase
MLGRFGQVSAIEPDDEARAYAATRSGVEVRGGLLPDGLPAFEAAFDLVAAFDVIEHVDQDQASLAALGQLLKPGGRLIATVPANQWMWSDHDVRHHHKRRYTLEGFRAVVQGAGLEVRKSSYFNSLLFPAIGAVRLAKIAAHAHGGDDEAMPGPALNRALHTVFAAEKPILRGVDLPFGVSILVIAQRPQ